MQYDQPVTKTEIRDFTRRTKQAARAIESWMAEEKRLRERGLWTREIEMRLRDLAEEISGCGSEVQNLLHARYSLDG